MPLDQIYPPVEYPVSRGTHKISPLIKWNHSENYFVSKFELQDANSSGERKVNISLDSDNYAFVEGHRIDGVYIF